MKASWTVPRGWRLTLVGAFAFAFAFLLLRASTAEYGAVQSSSHAMQHTAAGIRMASGAPSRATPPPPQATGAALTCKRLLPAAAPRWRRAPVHHRGFRAAAEKIKNGNYVDEKSGRLCPVPAGGPSPAGRSSQPGRPGPAARPALTFWPRRCGCTASAAFLSRRRKAARCEGMLRWLLLGSVAAVGVTDTVTTASSAQAGDAAETVGAEYVVDPDIHPLERIKQWTEQIEKNNGSAFCHSLSTSILAVRCVRGDTLPC
eukprot:COSAG06_NODE_2398_length_6956_cov_2.091877_4_plen_259_part_00